jgi:D-alanine-D-alanine ligase
MDALKVAGYPILPIYITKEGGWFAGAALHNIKQYSSRNLALEKIPGVQRVSLSPDRSVRELITSKGGGWALFRKSEPMWADVFFPAVHGTMGEDGTLQGLFELADVPYVGSGVLSSAVGMDKVKAKQLFRESGLKVLDCLAISRAEWENDPEQFTSLVEKSYGYPLIVKPVCLGSSIGVTRCKDLSQLHEAIEVALTLDEYALVEKALTDFIEINCSVIGPPEQVSVCEQPTSAEALLSFDEKYKRGAKSKSGGTKGGMASLERIVPAPISDELTARIQEIAIKAFRVLGASGVARVDFLVDNEQGELFLNEINTMPGSIAFYLWEASGVPFDELVHRMVVTALEQHRVRSRTLHVFEANLLRSSA